MSTVPGPQSWQDAGLTGYEQAEPVMIDPLDTDDPTVAVLDTPDAVEHEPDEPRPDLDGRADAADVAEQATPVPDDERDEYR